MPDQSLPNNNNDLTANLVGSTIGGTPLTGQSTLPPISNSTVVNSVTNSTNIPTSAPIDLSSTLTNTSPSITANPTLPTKPSTSVPVVNPAPTTTQENPPTTDKISPQVIVKGTTTTGGYIMSNLMELVAERGASDMHLGAGYPPLMRVDDDLTPMGSSVLTPDDVQILIYSILPDDKKELLEVNKEIDLAYSYPGVGRFRINAFFERGHVSGAFRLIPNKIRTLEELNLPPIMNSFTQLNQGLVLITGPTGSGKSTTLAAILQSINQTQARHILTIEDPIEYIYPPAKSLISQREMHEDTHAWDIALRSAMRQDPDVVLVGEMRDRETISAAITVAETGQLVFATLHTNSASQTMDRIIDVFPPEQQSQIRTQLSVVIKGIVAQRLIPLKAGGIRAVNEILIPNSAVRNLVREGKTHQLDNVIRTGADQGMISMENSLAGFVQQGMITMEQALKFAPNPEEVERILKR